MNIRDIAWILVSVVLAIVIAFTGAWACTWGSEVKPSIMNLNKAWPTPVMSLFDQPPEETASFAGSGVRVNRYWRNRDMVVVSEVSAGWPTRCLRSIVVYPPSEEVRVSDLFTFGPIRSASWIKSCSSDRRMPIVPVWPEFVLSVGFYAIICFGIVWLIRLTRTFFRRRSGKCVRCGYPVQTRVCPECGYS
jgi:hypothetical protein